MLGAGADGEPLRAASADQVAEAVAAGTPVVTGDAGALIDSPVDIVIEATGLVEVAVRHAYRAILARKHLAMVTVEADVLVGYHLRKLAEAAGVIYSLAYGDEPALAAELCDWARTLGFRLVAAGKGTRFTQSFRKMNPDDVPSVYGFSGKDYNAQMFGSFLDGTKHSIEVVALANMTGLEPDVRGLHFPTAELREIPDVLASRAKGGILHREGAVEAVSAIHPDDTFVERSIRGGLFAVIDGPTPQINESLASYGDITGMIIGKRSGYAMIYRPQHFVDTRCRSGWRAWRCWATTWAPPPAAPPRWWPPPSARCGRARPSTAKGLHRVRHGRAPRRLPRGETWCRWPSPTARSPRPTSPRTR